MDDKGSTAHRLITCPSDRTSEGALMEHALCPALQTFTSRAKRCQRTRGPCFRLQVGAFLTCTAPWTADRPAPLKPVTGPSPVAEVSDRPAKGLQAEQLTSGRRAAQGWAGPHLCPEKSSGSSAQEPVPYWLLV